MLTAGCPNSPAPLPQVMDVAVMGLAGRMMAPALAAGLGPSRYWWLAAAMFGVGPSLMGMLYDRLVLGMQRTAAALAAREREEL
jgi:hypothetical protein